MSNTEEIKFNIPASFMEKAGKREMILIKLDASDGISQEYTGAQFGKYKGVYGTSYSSYTDYKANYMKRFGTRKHSARKITRKKGIFYTTEHQAAYVGRKGTKLKAYTGQSIKSNEIGFVNETLTGAMFRDMFIKDARENEVTVSYAQKDAGKVLGAESLGRILVGLNNENREIIKDMIAAYMSKQIDNWAKIDVNITITL